MSNGTSDWGDDIVEEPIDTDIPSDPLPKFLAELRDGTAPKAPEEGLARARRIESMKRDIGNLNDFMNDLDRYYEHSKSAELVGTDVYRYMNDFIRASRKKVQTKIRRMYEELNYLKDHS